MLLRPRPVTLHCEEFHVLPYRDDTSLKLCGFIDDQQARLASVDENHVAMDFGPRWWWQSLLTQAPRFRLRLTFQDAQPDDLSDRQNQLAGCGSPGNGHRAVLSRRIRPPGGSSGDCVRT